MKKIANISLAAALAAALSGGSSAAASRGRPGP